MTDELLPIEGISRRDLLKRSAIVGGASAMVWAAPSITTLGGRAFGANGTPLTASFVAFIVECPNDLKSPYRVKWNESTDTLEDGRALPFCDPNSQFVKDYQAASSGGLNDKFTVTVQRLGGNRVSFTVSEPCTILDGEANGAVKEATDCRIVKGDLTNFDRTITFDLSIFEAD